MIRSRIIAGNWKMYKTIAEAKLFVENLAPHLASSQAQVSLAVPFTALSSLSEMILQKKLPITLGGQNMHEAKEGAFTGEISASMLTEAGADFVILGHSERRHIFNETSELINKKILRAIEEGLKVIFCVGEKLEEREADRTEEVLETQLKIGLLNIASNEFKKIIIAYEPVWAIGTGKVAAPSDAERAHKFIRDWISTHVGEEIARKMPLLYGGSVKPENASGLLLQENIDGLLVGGASLSVDSFSQIIKAA